MPTCCFIVPGATQVWPGVQAGVGRSAGARPSGSPAAAAPASAAATLDQSTATGNTLHLFLITNRN